METVDLVIWEGSTSVVNVPFPKRKRGMVTLCSTSSMTQSTTATDMGDPMVVPSVCWKSSPLYTKYVAFGHQLS